MNVPFSPRASAGSSTRKSRPRWRSSALEQLEGRALLSTFTVTDLSGNPNDAGSLPHAVQLANGAPGSTINFQSGLAGVIPLAGSLHLEQSVTINGPGAGAITVLGGGPQSNFSDFLSVAPKVKIAGLTIAGAGGQEALGGGILVFQGDVTVTGCTVANNFAELGGGGVFVQTGTLTMQNCTIANNSAGNGGGIATNGGTVFLTNCSIIGNHIDSTGIEGGAIDNRGHMTLTNCIVAGNSAQNAGGGIGNLNGILSLVNTTVAGNSGTTGGGIFANFGSTITLTNSTVSGNIASAHGGAIAVFAGGVTLEHSIVANNFLGAKPGIPQSNITGHVNPASAFNIIGGGGSGGLVNGVNENIVLPTIARLRHIRSAALSRHLR